ncbi:hypothetical protein IF1G_01097 [Cordyceps javanica]|uniref:Uncharacterized protein n=1 Tax=Cordyceps javanica TaxID=43265 RepID=A0A545VHN7_9HYPO|nr:hypothetical protein IF1G_01097 [Cordyceps javanica]
MSHLHVCFGRAAQIEATAVPECRTTSFIRADAAGTTSYLMARCQPRIPILLSKTAAWLAQTLVLVKDLVSQWPCPTHSTSSMSRLLHDRSPLLAEIISRCGGAAIRLWPSLSPLSPEFHDSACCQISRLVSAATFVSPTVSKFRCAKHRHERRAPPLYRSLSYGILTNIDFMWVSSNSGSCSCNNRAGHTDRCYSVTARARP